MLRFLKKATEQDGCPTLINIDKSGASRAGISAFNAESHGELPAVEIWQCKYLNNIVKQD